MTYTTHRDTRETLSIIDRLDLDSEKLTKEDIIKKCGYGEELENGQLTFWQNVKTHVWALFEEPNSSLAAKVRIVVVRPGSRTKTLGAGELKPA